MLNSLKARLPKPVSRVLNEKKLTKILNNYDQENSFGNVAYCNNCNRCFRAAR